MEDPLISGIAHSSDQSKVTVIHVPDVPGTAAAIFAVITKAVSTVDMIGQTHTAADTGLIDFSFALPVEDGHRAVDALRADQDRLGFTEVTYTDQVGKVPVVEAAQLEDATRVLHEAFDLNSEAEAVVYAGSGR